MIHTTPVSSSLLKCEDRFPRILRLPEQEEEASWHLADKCCPFACLFHRRTSPKMRHREAIHLGWLKVLLIAAAVLGVGAVAAERMGTLHWRSQSRKIQEKLLSARSMAGETFPFSELERLPPPVKRYLRWALGEGAPIVHTAHIRHEGTFRMSGATWVPFQSSQLFTVESPGFVWDARMIAGHVVPIRVRDAYVEGRGSLCAKLLGLLTVADSSPDANLDRGELMRYLAESVWFPTALLPSAGVRWSAIDEYRALAVLRDGETTASLEFRFSPEGAVTEVYSDDRPRTTIGTTADTPWRGRFSNYQRHNGMMIPVDGEVEWILPDGALPYWRASIVEIRINEDGAAAP